MSSRRIVLGSRAARSWLRRLALLCALAALIAAAPAVAQSSPGAVVAPPVETAPVVLDGRVLFRLRGISGFPASERAARVSREIEAFARDASVAPETLRLNEANDWYLEAGSHRVVSVRSADAALEGVRRATLAQVLEQKISAAVSEYRRERTPAELGRKSLRLLGAVAGAAGLLAVLGLGLRRAGRAVERRLAASESPRGIQVVSAAPLATALQGTLRGALRLVALATALGLLIFALRLYPWTRSSGNGLATLLGEPLIVLGRGFSNAVPGLIFIAILFVALRALLALVRVFFTAIGTASLKLPGFLPEWAEPTHRIVRALVVVLGVVVAFPYVPGSESAAFRGVTIFLGALVSLGSSSLISNLLAGYSLVYRRAFRIGDRIQVGDTVGDVTESRLVVTHLVTPKNEEVIVPNSQILNGTVVNYSSLARENRLILHTTVGIGYEFEWRRVEALLLEAAARTPGIQQEPKPFVLLRSLGDFAVTYELNVYTGNASHLARQYADLHRNVLDVFNENAVQIMVPAYESDPPTPKIAPPESRPRGSKDGPEAVPSTDSARG